MKRASEKTKFNVIVAMILVAMVSVTTVIAPISIFANNSELSSEAPKNLQASAHEQTEGAADEEASSDSGIKAPKEDSPSDTDIKAPAEEYPSDVDTKAQGEEHSLDADVDTQNEEHFSNTDIDTPNEESSADVDIKAQDEGSSPARKKGSKSVSVLAGGTDVDNSDYSYVASSGLLTVKTDAGSTAWKNDANIGATEQDRKNNIEAVVIGNNVTAIGDRAFRECANLKSLDARGCTNLQSIGIEAFFTCAKLESIDFSGCTSLQLINTRFRGIFENCTSLTNINFSGCTSIIRIPTLMFLNCSSLQNIDLSGCANLETITTGAFYDCSNLSKVILPVSLKAIESPFARCPSLTDIDLSKCTNLQRIETGSFLGCSKLSDVILPASLQTIGRGAFDNCTSLDSLRFLGTVAPKSQYTTNIFTNISGGTIYFPAGAEASYEAMRDDHMPTWTVKGLSPDASLSSVAGQPITAGSESGTATDPITAAVTVAGSLMDIGISDIVTSNMDAIFHIYSDNGFSQDEDADISLAVGADAHIYVKVESEDGSTVLYYDITVTRPDTIPPVPADATVSTANVTQTSLTLNWTAAADNMTIPAKLKYYVYLSASDNISTAADCTANGTLLNTGGADDIATYDVTGLTPNTTYYFNVVVEDEAGNGAAYTPISATTLATPSPVPPPPTIYTVLKHFDDFTGAGTSTALVNADHTKFVRLTLGGKEIPSSDYTFTQGSTIITLNEAHLKTYANGTYLFKAEFSDGISEDISLAVNVSAGSGGATGGSGSGGGAADGSGSGGGATGGSDNGGGTTDGSDNGGGATDGSGSGGGATGGSDNGGGATGDSGNGGGTAGGAPKTGDDTNIAALWLVLIGTLLGMARLLRKQS